jgi:subtilisin family serine protease
MVENTESTPIAESDESPAEVSAELRSRRIVDGLAQPTIALPLLIEIDEEDADFVHDVIVDLSLNYPQGLRRAKKVAAGRIKEVAGTVEGPEDAGLHAHRARFTDQYLFASLTRDQIYALLEDDTTERSGEESPSGSIYKVWLDHDVHAQLTESVSVIKADAARVAFEANGAGIVWAVMDSGIDGNHPHFARYDNLKLGKAGKPVAHCDFTPNGVPGGNYDPSALVDGSGHGTHVAGIIAGEAVAEHLPEKDRVAMRAFTRTKNLQGEVKSSVDDLDEIAGVAPKTQLVSLKVLDGNGIGRVSSILEALAYVQEINDYGKWDHIHGINLSVGYEFDAEWFACGKSPLCIEVDRLVRSGVVVVTAAGNTGYGFAQTTAKGVVKAGLDLTINDPGNAELAITVGSTHRKEPHTYGVSYFSSKGPTGDGRLKPDLIAPGERVVSCAAGKLKQDMEERADDGGEFLYVENSGTSMAAPHVSGAVAALLSIRSEFKFQPDRVKEIFMSTATDLGRDSYFQGQGLVDLMRAIQSV